jgi:hypothetical protein
MLNYKHVKCFLKNLQEYYGGCAKNLFDFVLLAVTIHLQLDKWIAVQVCTVLNTSYK